MESSRHLSREGTELPPRIRGFRLLGEFRVVIDDHDVREPPSAGFKLLLSWLLLHRTALQPRAAIAFALWPDSSEGQALANLRNLLARLRQWLPELDQCLVIERFGLGIQLEVGLELDVDRLERLLLEDPEQETLAEVLRLYVQDLLPLNTESWIVAERVRIRRGLLAWLKRTVECLEERRQYDAALRGVRRCLKLDPLHEPSWEAHMRLLALTGERTEALRVWRRCVTTFRRERATEPGDHLREVYERLLRTTPGPVPPSSSWRLIGRETEWRALLGAWRRTLQGRPEAVLVRGAAGIGKTRLLDDLIDFAVRQNVSTAATRCYELDRKMPFRAVISLLSGCDLEPLPLVYKRELARLLPELMDSDPFLESLGTIQTPWHRHTLFEAIAHGLLAQQPLLVAVDDVQWIDDDSLEFLHFLIRFNPGARLLVAFALRDIQDTQSTAIERLLLSLHHDSRLSVLRLQVLDQVHSLELASQVAGGSLVPGFGRSLFQRSGGTPFFIVELTRAEQGGRSEGTLQESGLLEAVLDARLANLCSEARHLAELSAILGRAASASLLERLSQTSLEVFLRALDELIIHSIFIEVQTDIHDFTHGYFREHVTRQLSSVRQRYLHLKAARGLEQEPASELDGLSAEIADHLIRAGAGVEAVRWLLRAAQNAVRMMALPQAIESLDRGLELLAGEDEFELQAALLKMRLHVMADVSTPEHYAKDIQRLRRLAEAHGAVAMLLELDVFELKVQVRHGLGQEALVRAEVLLQGKGYSDNPTAEAELRMVRAHVLLHRLGRPWDALRDVWRAQEIHHATSPDSLDLRLEDYQCDCLFRLGRHAEAWKLAQAGLNMAEAAGDPVSVAQFQGRLAHFAQETAPSGESSLQLIDDSLATLQRMGLPYRAVTCKLIKGSLLMGLRRFCEARRILLEVIQISQDLGVPDNILHATLRLGLVSRLMGDMSTCLSYLETNCDYQAIGRFPILGLITELELAETYWELGALEVAESRLEALEAEAADLASIPFACRLPLLRGRILLGKGDPRAACSVLEQACSATPTSYMPLARQNLIECQTALAEAELLAGEPHAALFRLRPMMKELERGLNGLLRPQWVYLVQARALAEVGDGAGVRSALERARSMVLGAADLLEDPEERRSYVSNVAINQAILSFPAVPGVAEPEKPEG